MTQPIINVVPSPTELQSYKIIAEVASNNPFWRRLGGNGTPESVIATILSVMLLARELGISPIQAISGGINNIQGKFEISARLMNQLIRKNGHKLSIKSSSDTECVIWSKRKDTGEEHLEKYTIEDAIKSGLVKEGSAWKKIPSDMLFARCISRLARRLYADCIGGCYIDGELQESINGSYVTSESLKEIKETKQELENQSLNCPAKIGHSEVIEIQEILDACSPDYKHQVMVGLKKSGIDSLENIPMFLYERIKSAGIKKREEFYKECSPNESNYEMEEMNV